MDAKDSELEPLCTPHYAIGEGKGDATEEQGKAPTETEEDQEKKLKESAAVIAKHLQLRI